MDFRPFKKTLISIAICVSLFGCSNNDDNEAVLRAEVQAHLNLADVYKNDGQFRASVIETQNAYQKMPNNLDIMRFIATLFLEIGDIQIDAALKIAPGDARLALLKAEAALATNDIATGLAQLQNLQVSEQDLDKKEWLEGSLRAAEGNNETAKTLLNKIIARNSGHAPSLISLAKIAYLEGNLEESNRYTTQAAGASVNDEDVFLWQGQLALLQENYPAAEEAYKNAIDLMANYDVVTAKKFSALQSILIPLQKLNKNEEALVYSNIIAASPQGQISNSFTAAVDLFQKGSLDEAEAAINTLLESAPNHPGSNILLGLTKLTEGDFSSAEKLLSEYVNASTATPQVIGALATTHLQTGHPEKAIAVLEDASKANPELVDIRVMIAAIQADMGNADQAIETLNAVLSQQPQTVNALITLSNIKDRQGNGAEAIQALEKAITADPSSIDAKSRLLALLSKTKNYVKAEEYIKSWLSQDSSSFSYNLLAGILQLDQAKYSDARKYFSTSLKQDAENVPAQLYLVRTDIAEKNYTDATAKLDALLAKQPNNPDAISSMLAIGEISGDPSMGASKVAKLAADNPNSFEAPLILTQYYLNKNDLPSALTNAELAHSASQNRFTKKLLIDALNRSAVSALQANTPAEVEKLVERSLELQADNTETISLQVALAATAKNWPLALDKIASIRAIQPDSSTSYLFEGDILMAQGKSTEALAAYRAGWDKTATPDIGTKLYQAMKSQKQDKEAAQFLDEWAAKDASSPAPHLLLSMEAQLANKNPDAIRHLEKVKELAPDNMIMLNNLAWLYQDSNPQTALALAKRASELYPNNAEVLDTYGWILHKTGDQTQAKATLEQALKITPDSASIKSHLQELN
jgi:cellulose synthase operon protein C